MFLNQSIPIFLTCALQSASASSTGLCIVNRMQINGNICTSLHVGSVTWPSCRLAAFAVRCSSFLLRLRIFGGWSDCYWHIQVMELVRHWWQVQFTDSSLGLGLKDPSGSLCTFSVNLTSVPLPIIRTGAGSWTWTWGECSTVLCHGGNWGSPCCPEAGSDIRGRCRPVSHTAGWVRSSRQSWTFLLSEIETSMVAGCPLAKWYPCRAGLGLPVLLVHLLGLAASMLETGSSLKFSCLSRCFCQEEKY